MIRITFKRLAIGKVPESCGTGGDVCIEALTGLCECRVSSPEIKPSGVRAVKECDGQQLLARNGESVWYLAGSETLSERTKDNLRENREIPWSASGAMPLVRIVKLKDARR